MRLRKTIGLMAVVLSAGFGDRVAVCGVIEYFDRAKWEAAVGDFTTLGFTGFPEGTFITDQYADLGILFVGGGENINLQDDIFPNDGAGLNSDFVDIVMEFATPQFWIGADFPGIIRIDLYNEGELFYSSIDFGGPPIGAFGGLLSSDPFDMAVILNPVDLAVFIDDLFFGPHIPAPGALWLLAVSALCARRRRRSGLTGPASTED